jgi:hypothetical protein
MEHRIPWHDQVEEGVLTELDGGPATPDWNWVTEEYEFAGVDFRARGPRRNGSSKCLGRIRQQLFW